MHATRLFSASPRCPQFCSAGVALLLMAGAAQAQTPATTVSGPVQTLDGAQALNPTLPNKLTDPFSGAQVVGGPSLNDANLSVSGRSNSSWVPMVAPFDAARPNLLDVNGARALPLTGSDSFGWRASSTFTPAPADLRIGTSTYTRSPAGTWSAPEPADGEPLNGVRDYAKMMQDTCRDMPAKCAGSGALPGTAMPAWAMAPSIPLPAARTRAAHRTIAHTAASSARPKKDAAADNAAAAAKKRKAQQ